MSTILNPTPTLVSNSSPAAEFDNGPDVFTAQVTLTSPPTDLFGAAIVDAFIDARGGDDVIEGTATVTSSNTQSSLTLNAVADTYVRTDLDVRRNDNYGLDRNMNVGTSRDGGGIPDGGPDAERALLKFDFSGITGLIKNARLELSIVGIGGGTGNSEFNVEVHRILDSWTEGNGQEFPFPSTVPGAVGTDPADGVAWAGAGDNPAPDAANNQTQPSFDSTAIASTTVTQGVDNRGDVVTLDITSLVQDWVNGSSQNYGLMLIDPSSDGSFRELAFGTREGDLYPDAFPDEVTGPRLVIEFEATAAGTAEAVGVVSSLIDAGAGDDTLSFSATATGLRALADGVKWAKVQAGSGNDNLSITGIARGEIQGQSYGLYKSSVETGNGDDTLTITVTSSSDSGLSGNGSLALAYGVSQSSIKAGSGDDVVNISVTGSAGGFIGGPGMGYGVYQASVYLGAGNDSLIISATGNGSGIGDCTGTGYGVYQSSIYADDGDDYIIILGEGNGLGGYVSGGSGIGYGIYQSSITTGNGNDTLTISGTGKGFVYLSGGFDIGYGAYQSTLSTGSGDDRVTISGLSEISWATTPGSIQSYGIYQSSIDTGSGNDSLTITGSSVSYGYTWGGSYGVYQSSIDTGSGNDNLTILGSSIVSYGFIWGGSYGVYQSSVDGGTGDDIIGISSSTNLENHFGTSYGIDQSSVNGGDGNDTLSFSALASGFESSAYGVKSATVVGGRGDDVVNISAISSVDFFYGGSITGGSYGLYESSVEGGSGNDVINISGTVNITSSIPDRFINPANGHIYFLTDPAFGTSWTAAEAQAVATGGHLVTINDAAEQAWLNSTFNTFVDFGGSLVRESFWIGLYDPQGDDTDEWVSGEPVTYTNWAAGEPNNLGEQYGELNPIFAPDQWNDRSDFPSEIGGRGIVEIVPEYTAYGVYQSSVEGGNGNDTINISGTNFAIKDALISGGEGNDTFNTGIGQGTIDGGRGNDLILLDFFNAATMTIEDLGDNRLQIVGSQDNQGNAATWTQTILNMEQFQVGGTIFSTARDTVNFLQSVA